MTTTTPMTALQQTLPLLTRDEERALGHRVRDGIRAVECLGGRAPVTAEDRSLAAVAVDGEEAFNRLVLSNIRLVTHFVGRLERPSGMQRSDIEQHGVMGLMKAARRYNPVKYPGVRFSTYATYWIRQAVLRAVKQEGAPIRVPDYLFNAAKVMRMGREVPASIKELVAKYQAIVVLGAGEGDSVIAAVAAPSEGPSITEEVEALAVAMADLPDRERAVIEARFYRHESLEAIGVAMGISKERVRQIQINALKRLRKLMDGRGVAV